MVDFYNAPSLPKYVSKNLYKPSKNRFFQIPEILSFVQLFILV